MNKFPISVFLSLFLALCLFPSSSLACACCAESGHYSLRTAKPSDYETQELRKIKFQTVALYAPGDESDAVEGISPLGANFSVNGSLNANLWSFDFTDDRKKTGKLDLAKPLSMVEYMVDLPGANDGASDVKLYKEWRFKYKIRNAAGIFKTGFAPQNEYF